MAATLYCLADERRMQKVASSFSIEINSFEIIYRMTQNTSKHLENNNIEETASNFYNSHFFQQCI